MGIDWDKHAIGPNMKVFGDPIVHRPASGGSQSLIGVFDAGYEELTILEDGSTNTTVGPVLGVQLSKFNSAPVQGDNFYVSIADTTYTVREVRQDSHGHALLMLNKVRDGQ